MVGLARFNFIVPLHSKIFAGQTQHTCPHATIKRTVVNDKTFIETRKDINPDIRKFNSLFFYSLLTLFYSRTNVHECRGYKQHILGL